jgi:TolA-binding protein
VALLLAVAIFIYNAVTPVAPNTPSPWVARGIEAVPPPSDPLVPPVIEPMPATAAPAAPEAGPIAGTEPAPAPVIESQSKTPGPATAPVIATAEPPPAAAAAPAIAEPQPATKVVESEPEVIAEAPAGPLSPIRISRTHATSEHDRMVRTAYAAYQAGDYQSAAVHYLAVLNDRPDTLDALVGMGAVALKSNDLRRAAEYFGRVLKLDPKNQTAAAALIGLQRGSDPTESESALKYMLQESPDSPFLYFILGNVYAAQSRWPEAQQAFFDAYRNDSAKPDYAMNLAASLDRLGQSQPALDYYGVALKLAESQPAGFDTAKVRARVQMLSGGQTP